MNNFNFKKLIPHAIAVAIFLAVTFAYLNPLLKGKVIVMGDISNFKGMSKELVDYREATGEEAQWTNSMFSGMPAYQISVAYPANLLKYVDNLLMLYLPRPADYIFLTLIGFYFLMCVVRVDKWLGILGSIAYAFGSYYIISIDTGHTSKVHAMAYIAPILASFILAYRGRYLLGGALTALFLGLQLYCNHLQITYYTILLIGVYVIFELTGTIKEKTWPNFIKASATVGVAALVALLPNIGNLWFSYEYGNYTTRGKSELTIPSPADGPDKASAARNNQTGGLPRDYITGWSYGVGETFTLMIPNYKGGESEYIIKSNKNALKNVDTRFKKQIGQSNAYFGDQPFTAGPTYAGAIVIFLFVLGLLFYKGRLKWALLIATALSIMLAWGSNFQAFTDFMIDFLPGYNKFRSVSMTMVIANFCIPALGILGLYKILNTPDFLNREFTLFGRPMGKNLYAFIGAFAVTGGLCLLMYLMPTTFNTFLSAEELDQFNKMSMEQGADPQMSEQISIYMDSLETARINIFQADALRSAGFILAAAVLLFLYFRMAFDKRILIGILGILVLADMVMVDLRFLDKQSFEVKAKEKVPFPETAAIKSILDFKDLNARTLNMASSPFNDASTSYYTKSIGGYHGAKLKRYQQLIEFRLSQEIDLIRTTLSGRVNDSIMANLLHSIPTLNMLNTKYVIYNPNAPALINPAALGNAWFVQELKEVANPDSEILALNKIDPAITAVVDKSHLKGAIGKFTFDSTASIKLTAYKPNELVYESNAKTDQLAVFSEIYYANGWQAYVDGQPVDHFRVNFVLRAMVVPAGKHKIEFKFEPKPYKTSEQVAFAGSILLFLLLGGAAFMEWRKKNNTGAEA